MPDHSSSLSYDFIKDRGSSCAVDTDIDAIPTSQYPIFSMIAFTTHFSTASQAYLLALIHFLKQQI